jgi:hypothetical protein
VAAIPRRKTAGHAASDRPGCLCLADPGQPGARLGGRGPRCCRRRRHDQRGQLLRGAAEKTARVGIAAEEIDRGLDELDITVTPFGRLDARLAASFYRHRSNLNLADRVCLALGRSLSSPVYTSDRNWEDWADHFGVTVVVIR